MANRKRRFDEIDEHEIQDDNPNKRRAIVMDNGIKSSISKPTIISKFNIANKEKDNYPDIEQCQPRSITPPTNDDFPMKGNRFVVVEYM